MPKIGNYEKKVVPFFTLIRVWKRDGMTDEEIWTRLGIKKSAYYDYKNKHPEFKEILRFDKEMTDAEVENQALDNAKGYLYEEEQIVMKKEIFYDEQGKKTKEVSTPEIVKVTKRKLSDQQATQWWLKNRLPGKWKDKQELDLGNSDGRPFKLEDVI